MPGEEAAVAGAAAGGTGGGLLPGVIWGISQLFSTLGGGILGGRQEQEARRFERKEAERQRAWEAEQMRLQAEQAGLQRDWQAHQAELDRQLQEMLLQRRIEAEQEEVRRRQAQWGSIGDALSVLLGGGRPTPYRPAPYQAEPIGKALLGAQRPNIPASAAARLLGGR